MDNIRDFIDMGGYAAYVWPSWGAVVLVMVVLLVLSRRALKHAEDDLGALEGTDQHAQDRTEAP